MSVSIQILQSYRVEEISRAYGDSTGKFLVLEGGNYENVKYVLVDGVKIEDIALQGFKLYVQLPKGLTAKDVKSIYPISETKTIDQHNLLQFSLGVYPKKIEGISRLVQLFVKTLFTSPGTSLIFPMIGGGLGAIYTRGYDMGKSDKIIPDIVAAVSKTEKDVKEMQASLRIPAEERLTAASIVSTGIDANSGVIECVLALTPQTGTDGVFFLAF